MDVDIFWNHTCHTTDDEITKKIIIHLGLNIRGAYQAEYIILV